MSQRATTQNIGTNTYKKVLKSLSGAFSALQPKADCTLTPK